MDCQNKEVNEERKKQCSRKRVLNIEKRQRSPTMMQKQDRRFQGSLLQGENERLLNIFEEQKRTFI
jgi:hypothetical protein